MSRSLNKQNPLFCIVRHFCICFSFISNGPIEKKGQTVGSHFLFSVIVSVGNKQSAAFRLFNFDFSIQTKHNNNNNNNIFDFTVMMYNLRTSIHFAFGQFIFTLIFNLQKRLSVIIFWHFLAGWSINLSLLITLISVDLFSCVFWLVSAALDY